MTDVVSLAPDVPAPGARDMFHWRDDLRDIVAALRISRDVTHNIRHGGEIRPLPVRAVLGTVIDHLAAALFPSHFGRAEVNDDRVDFYVGHTLDEALTLLTEQVRRELALFAAAPPGHADPRLEATAANLVRQFAVGLPDIRALLTLDLMAAFSGDPAARSTPEIMLGYPGFLAVLHHRVAHALRRRGLVLVPRLLAQIAHSKTGIDIHPGAAIGRSFFIDHGTGVVIGETAIIGDRVRLYQAVTLGARSFEEADDGSLVKGLPRHPVIEDDVVIYAGATVLGRVTVGRGSVIGGNVWLTRSVPAGSSITQARTQAGPDKP